MAFSFCMSDKCITPLVVISLNRYNQKHEIRMVVAGQMRHVCSVLAIAAETP
jgi:hypothetical protein